MKFFSYGDWLYFAGIFALMLASWVSHKSLTDVLVILGVGLLLRAFTCGFVSFLTQDDLPHDDVDDR